MSTENSNTDHKKKLEHFSNLVKLSLADKVINHAEQEFLDTYAKHLDVSKAEYHDILLNPDKYQFKIPVTKEERIERLYYLVKLSFSDGEILNDEVERIKTIALDLGFKKSKIEKLLKKAIHLTVNKYKFETFSKKIDKFLSKK